jgi:hypothetical protein
MPVIIVLTNVLRLIFAPHVAEAFRVFPQDMVPKTLKQLQGNAPYQRLDGVNLGSAPDRTARLRPGKMRRISEAFAMHFQCDGLR